MRSSFGRTARFVVLAIISALMLCPLLWALFASLRPASESFAQGNVFFGTHLSLENFEKALSLAPFARYYLNTILQVGMILAAQVSISCLAAFAFARYRFRGDKLLFTVILLQMMIPTAALIVPNFSTIRVLGLYDSIPGIALPFCASAFGIFLMRQTFMAMPRELVDAAEIDGCSWYHELWHLYVPTSTPTIVALVLSSLSFHWNDLLWPLVVTQSDSARPLTAGLVRFTQMGEIGAQWGLLAAATMIVVLPLVILFLVFQKQFVRGYISSGLK